ncbi:MAG TPA: MarR family transcriptional regulator [Terriglobales bacterium]|nr:MarR family transcriptional regulator [Terriglobales bacterium]
MATTDPPLDPDIRDLLRAYLDVVTMSEPHQSRLWQSAQLTMTQLRTLRSLRDGPRAAGELGRKLGLSATSMTRILDRLEDRLLLQRSRDGEDRRKVLVTLLPEGRRLVGEMPLLGGRSLLGGSALLAAVEELTVAQRRQVTAALRLLIDRVREVEEREAAPDAAVPATPAR